MLPSSVLVLDPLPPLPTDLPVPNVKVPRADDVGAACLEKLNAPKLVVVLVLVVVVEAENNEDPVCNGKKTKCDKGVMIIFLLIYYL